MVNKNPYSDLSKKIYYSFWSWSLIKQCPLSYKLRVLDKVEMPKKASKHNAIQGGVPDALATDFFQIPIKQRDMNFFLDEFDNYWDAWLKENYCDFAIHGLNELQKEAKTKNGVYIPEDPKELEAIGYKLRYDETKQSTTHLMRLISHMNLHKMEADTQVPFNVTIEAARSHGSMFSPELAMGGRIDLVIKLPRNQEEIWDIKAVKNPKQLDEDQLLIYKMGRQAAGQTVKRTGYLHAKQCKADVKKFYPVHENRLKKLMRQSMIYFRQDSWPANYVKWKCKYCDVNFKCDTYKRKTQGTNQEVIKLTGKKGTKVDL